MKLKYILPILFITLFTTACSTDDETPENINETEGLIKIQDIVNDDQTIELYSQTGSFKTGYNNVSIRIKNNSDQTYFEDASMSWIPMMQMPTMQHSCPHSAISKVSDKKTLYTGSVIYQMTGEGGSGWSLTVNYTVNNVDYSVKETISVSQADKQNVTSFMGLDEKRYIVALIEPLEPIIGINDMMVGLYQMENMMSFPAVENYKIMLDPRMPGMGNHSSPNNTDLSYDNADTMYHGNLSLTMTGYWVLNLKLLNASEDILKGEDVTEENEKSSLYLELEF